jgi:hypothetical protein
MLMDFSMMVLSSQLVVAVADHPPAWVDSASGLIPTPE